MSRLRIGRAERDHTFVDVARARLTPNRVQDLMNAALEQIVFIAKCVKNVVHQRCSKGSCATPRKGVPRTAAEPLYVQQRNQEGTPNRSGTFHPVTQ
jgi:hypothetical protein